MNNLRHLPADEQRAELALAETLCNCQSVFKHEGGPKAHTMECAYAAFCDKRKQDLRDAEILEGDYLHGQDLSGEFGPTNRGYAY